MANISLMALICKQLRPIDIPAQESVCKGPNLHRCHIRQCVAEDPGLMHRVKKVAFRTRLQSVMSPRVYNHHFFTRNNSCLDLSRQCHAPRLKNECRPLFSSPNQNQTSCPCWYTRSAFQSIPSFSFTFDQKDVCWTIGVLYASMMSFGSTFRFMTVLIWMGKGSQ